MKELGCFDTANGMRTYSSKEPKKCVEPLASRISPIELLAIQHQTKKSFRGEVRDASNRITVDHDDELRLLTLSPTCPHQ